MRRRLRVQGGIATAFMMSAVYGCHRRDPPMWIPDAAPSATAQIVTDASAPATSARPPDVDPATLPQTRDKPRAGGDAFDDRVHSLWDAVVADDPKRAMGFFFPRAAYAQVKAIANPDADWRGRLVRAYERDIHALHAKVAGRRAAAPRFVSIEVPNSARWVEPNEEWNRIGYYRVYSTHITYEIGSRTHAFTIASMISWRGQWYVVHLSGFK